MGDEAAPQFEQEFGGKVPNEDLQAYVEMVGQKTAIASEREMPYSYTLVSSDIPNAFALPGGKIFLTAGLMKLMSNERQLAAVLGHETGHVSAQHNVQGMQRQMGAQVLVEVVGSMGGTKGDAAAAGAQVVTTMANLSYSREDEYESDMLGIRYMTRAGYNPWGMVELQQVLLDLNEKEPGRLEELFSSHPVSSKRIEQAKALIAENHPDASETETDPYTDRFLKMRALLP